MSATLADSIGPDSSAFAMRLARNIKGEVMFDRASRGRYATDASIYQMEPVGVVVPETTGDVVAAMAIARDEGVPVLPRGGGTSQCGQTVNRALVIDCSKHLRRILRVDAAARTALVEPGLVLGHLNAALRADGLFFPVDPSTHARCTIGGMAGNNSCGSKSIRYGLMADNVGAIEAILSDGSEHRFSTIPDNLGERMPGSLADLIQRLRVLGASEADEIAARFPKQLRRVGGYNIDALTPAARASGRDNLARLLVGSEGTLAFSAAIELTLHPIKPRKVIGICQFPSFRKAMEASKHIVALEPEAVELVDCTMIDLGRGIPIYRPTIDRMLLGEPESLLIVEFHEQMFGPRIVRAFEAVKDAFDPIGLLNPNRITQPPRMDDRTLFRYGPGYGPISGFVPKLDWSEQPGPLGGMLAAVEMCNNNGSCRAFDAGVMCPSYRVTRDETHVTRGRANTLRLALTGQLGADAMTSEPMAEAMALCVSCKACKRECPTGVDMAKMKIEVAAARAERHGVKWRESLIAELPRYAPFVARMPELANLRNYLPPSRWLTERFLGLSAARSLPKWRRDRFLDNEALTAAPASPKGDVYLLGDTFNRYFEPENLRAALRVLAAAGYRAILPKTDGRPLCCGRTWLAVGMVDKARGEAERTMRHLAEDLPIVGLEPACVMTLRDEFRSLLPGAATNRFADRSMLLSEFVAREKPSLALRALPGTARVHGHCHQKAFGAFPDALAMLRQIPKLSAQPIESSCCGMAGTFGYQAETEATSRAMAEAGLLPAIRAAAPHDFIVADGTSCRHQIRDLSGREAIHSVRLMQRALEVAR